MNKGLRTAAVWSAIAAASLIGGGFLYAALTASFDLGAALSIVSGVISAGVSVLLARDSKRPS